MYQEDTGKTHSMMRREIRRRRRAQDSFTKEHVLMWESVVSRWRDWPEQVIRQEAARHGWVWLVVPCDAGD